MERSEIHLDRIILRPFVKTDLSDMTEVLSDPEVMRFSLSGPYSKEKTEQFISNCLTNYDKHGTGLLAVVYRRNMKVIGYCGFAFQNIDGVEEVEIGYRLHRDYWGRGLATEASRAIGDLGFNQLGYKRMISIIEAQNTASIRVAEKNGLHYEKDAVFRDSVPVRIYAVTSDLL